MNTGVVVLRDLDLSLGCRQQFEKLCRDKAHTIPVTDALVARVLGEYPLFVHPGDDSVSMRIAFDGFWEFGVTRAIARLLGGGGEGKRESLVLDVGANVGYFSLLAATMGYDVVSFEAQSALCRLMQRSSGALGSRGRWVVERGAVSDPDTVEYERRRPEEYKGYITPARAYNLGSARLVEGHDEGDGERVHHVTIDEALARLAWHARPVALMKLDIEGSELGALQGAGDTLLTNPDLRLCMEWSPQMLGVNAEPLLELLASHGFDKLQVLDGDGDPHPTDRVKLLEVEEFEMLWLHRDGWGL